jgi:hypothetical protein
VVQSAGELLPPSSAVAAAKSDLEIEQLERGAFDEVAERLAEAD